MDKYLLLQEISNKIKTISHESLLEYSSKVNNLQDILDCLNNN